MPDIGFKRLSRGVKLLTGHIQTQIQKALTRVTDTGFVSANMEAGNSRFRMSFPWSGLEPKAAGGTDTRYARALFSLPPPQEMFRTTGAPRPNDISYVLDGIMLSFDQRAEVWAINEDGTLNTADGDKLTFVVSVFGKTPTLLNSSATTTVDTQLASITFDALNFSNAKFYQNPVTKSGLGIAIDAYQTLVLEIDLSQLQATAANLICNSLIVGLDFYAPLIDRDTTTAGAPTVQNIPTAHYGARSNVAEALTIPAAGAIISAENPIAGSDGVQTSFEKVDKHFRDRLVGGYTEKSSNEGISNILTDAAYEIIAVPMWGNGWTVKGGAATTAATLPFMNAVAPFNNATCDRRIIPLRYPIVIHHVLASASLGSLIPTSATFNTQIGVGLGCGTRSDLFESRQVAMLDFTTLTKANYLIDTVGIGSEKFELYNVPLTYLAAAANGTGYGSLLNPFKNGEPVFCGQALTTEVTRTPLAPSVGAAAPAAPLMQGQEQYLEVRWAFQDSGGIDNMAAGAGVIGFGGHWVYIIGKKHLC